MRAAGAACGGTRAALGNYCSLSEQRRGSLASPLAPLEKNLQGFRGKRQERGKGRDLWEGCPRVAVTCLSGNFGVLTTTGSL